MMDKKESLLKNNILVSVLGWEERFIIGLKKDIEDNNLNSCIVVIFSDYFNKKGFNEIMKLNLQTVKDICNKRKIIFKTIELEYTVSSNILNPEILENALNEFKSSNFLLDISTIPNEIIWNLLTISKKIANNIKLIYHKPNSYSKDDWLCRNFYKPLLQIGHSGIFEFGSKTALIIFTGFDTERTKQLITHFEPDIVYLFLQEGEQFDNYERNNKKHEILFDYLNIKTVKIDSYNIDEGAKILISTIKKVENYNIILSSLGPKLSSIIAYKAFEFNKKIGLAYVPANEININYSEGLKESLYYDFKIDN